MQAPDAYLRPALDKHLQPIRHVRVQPGRGGRREAFKIRVCRIVVWHIVLYHCVRVRF